MNVQKMRKQVKAEIVKIFLRVGVMKKYDHSSVNYLRQSSPRSCGLVENKRATYSVSYVESIVRTTLSTGIIYFWQKVPKGKETIIIFDEHRIQIKAQLEKFFVQFDPENRMWVEKGRGHYIKQVIMKSEPQKFSEEDFTNSSVTVTTRNIDFSKAVFMFTMTYPIADMGEISLPFYDHYDYSPKVARALEQFTAQINGMNTEMNETLTGVKNDGALTYLNLPLADNLICKKCGRPVFNYGTDTHYIYFCTHCREKISGKDIIYIDNNKYNNIYKCYLGEIQQFLTESNA